MGVFQVILQREELKDICKDNMNYFEAKWLCKMTRRISTDLKD